jgi:hypothetical protein
MVLLAPVLLAALAPGLAAPPGAAPDDAPAVAADAAAPGAPPNGHLVEVKVASTNRGSPGESSRTTLRSEVRPGEGPLTALRLDLPWVNKNNDFVSDPGNAGLGDLAVKATFRVPGVGSVRLSPYLEVKLPSAQPSALGSGKVVAVPGLVASRPLPVTTGGRAVQAEVELSANASVAGDPERADVGYATLEAKVRTSFSAATSVEWVVKPSVDWAQGRQWAGVAEATFEWTPGPWRLALKVGRRLWGGAVGGSYDDKLELAARRTW